MGCWKEKEVLFVLQPQHAACIGGVTMKKEPRVSARAGDTDSKWMWPVLLLVLIDK